MWSLRWPFISPEPAVVFSRAQSLFSRTRSCCGIGHLIGCPRQLVSARASKEQAVLGKG